MGLPTQKTMFARSARDYIMMIFGPPGVGKTTFVNDFGNVLILSTDRGTRFMPAQRVECLSWNKFLKTLDALEKPNAPKYDFICVDHADDFADMAEEATCKELNIASLSDADFGKGWKAFKNKIKGFNRRVLRLGTGVVFIAHEDIKEVKTRSLKLNRTMPMLPKTAWKAIIPLADLVGYAGFRSIKQENGKRKEVRTIETQPREDLYAKDRTKRDRPSKGYALLDGAEFIKTFDSSSTVTDDKETQDGEEEHPGQEGRVGRRGRRARAS